MSPEIIDGLATSVCYGLLMCHVAKVLLSSEACKEGPPFSQRGLSSLQMPCHTAVCPHIYGVIISSYNPFAPEDNLPKYSL